MTFDLNTFLASYSAKNNPDNSDYIENDLFGSYEFLVKCWIALAFKTASMPREHVTRKIKPCSILLNLHILVNFWFLDVCPNENCTHDIRQHTPTITHMTLAHTDSSTHNQNTKLEDKTNIQIYSMIKINYNALIGSLNHFMFSNCPKTCRMC